MCTELTQSGILAEETNLARYLEFSIHSIPDIRNALKVIVTSIEQDQVVIGLGHSLVTALGKNISGLQVLPEQVANDIKIPSTPVALWCWIRGNDRGELFHQSRNIESLLAPAFTLDDVTDSFQYDENRDLSGYEDGTENPQGKDLIQAAIVQNKEAGFNGSSFVAVQKWLHDFASLDAMTTTKKDNIIGRHISDNEEFDEAPVSAHVKRTAQESYDPEAFMLRRSMPWAEEMNAGLIFVAFGHSFYAFEAQLNRMLGNEDGVSDALFEFTSPITGAYYWCPPIKSGRLDLSLLGL